MPTGLRLSKGLFRVQQGDFENDEKDNLLRDEKEEIYRPSYRRRMIAHQRNNQKGKLLRQGKNKLRGLCAKLPLISYFVYLTRRRNLKILHLEDCILRKIHQYLPLVDGVCLSLTCKRLFDLFGANLKREELDFPRLLKIRKPILCVNSRDVPRNQLLLRLANRDWAYCGKCLKLHPRKDFNNFIQTLPPIGWSCSEHAGIIDICPCAAWTLRERERVVRVLKSGSTVNGARFGPFEFDDNEVPQLIHSCSLGTTPQYDARVTIRVLIDSSDHLVILAQYRIMLSSVYCPVKSEPLFACPHFNVVGFSTIHPVSECPDCHATVSRKSTRMKRKREVMFDVKRDLGSCQLSADSCWLVNCRITGQGFDLGLCHWSPSKHIIKDFETTYKGWLGRYMSDQGRLVEELVRWQRRRRY